MTAPSGRRTAEAVDAASSLVAAFGQALLCLDRNFSIVYASPFLDRLARLGCAERINGLSAEVVFGENLFGSGSSLRTALRSGRRTDGLRAAFRPGDGSLLSMIIAVAPVEPAGESPLDSQFAYVVLLRSAAEGGAAEERIAGADPDMIRIREALEVHRWRREEAAQALGISRTTLWRKMREYGLL